MSVRERWIGTPVSRRSVLHSGLGVLGALGTQVLAGAWPWRAFAAAALPPNRLDDFAAHVVSGGPPKDGIPPIEHPKYVPVAEADKWLRANDVIFGLTDKGVVKAFPQIILVWHEIVNEEIAGEPISVTYCPLTGSAVAYKGQSRADGKPLTFGTSGRLVNSNLLMYDRQTDSTWPQILGIAITGPSKGQRLDAMPLEWTTWEAWKRQYPATQVLSRETGHIRAYGQDPYGSYTGGGASYYTTGGPFFPVMAKSARFPDKKVVVGVKVDDDVIALPKSDAARAGIVNFALGGHPLVAVYDRTIDAVSVFVREAGGRALRFARLGDKITDEQTKSAWTPRGKAAAGTLAGTQLARAASFDVMWFAWYAFYPETRILVP